MNAMRLLTAAAFAAMTATIAHGHAALHVDDDAPLGGDGLSWDTAFRFLQDAMSRAADDPAVTEIRVAQGIYQPDLDEAGNVFPGFRSATFRTVEGVALLGGFAGIGAMNPDERDVEIFESVLTGDLLADDEGDFQNIDDNSIHVVIGVGDEATILDGFTITGGNANASFPGNLGGGMYNGSTSPTVTNCRFTGNSAVFGGGMYNSWGANPTITNCAFIGNRATDIGGGMRNLKSSPTVVNCTFSGNTAHVGGGMANHASNPTVVSCILIWNTADVHGGGMLNSDGSQPKVTNCTFSRNTAEFGGGISGGLAGTNCILWGDSPDELFGTSAANYSCVQGGNPGVGNIDADPLFVDPDNGDFRLLPGSPCIDAANNKFIPLRATDLDGNPRLVDDPDTRDTGPPGHKPIVDMGAYEYRGRP